MHRGQKIPGPKRVRMEARHGAESVQRARRDSRDIYCIGQASPTSADFALQIASTPSEGARQGSADELATLDLDGLLRLAVRIKDQGEAGLTKPKKKALQKGHPHGSRFCSCEPPQDATSCNLDATN